MPQSDFFEKEIAEKAPLDPTLAQISSLSLPESPQTSIFGTLSKKKESPERTTLDPVVVESVFSPLNEPTKAHICEIARTKEVHSVIFGATPVKISLLHPKEPSQTKNCDFYKKLLQKRWN